MIYKIPHEKAYKFDWSIISKNIIIYFLNSVSIETSIKNSHLLWKYTEYHFY